MNEREEILGAIAALEAQRDLLGDRVVTASTAALRARLASLPATERQRKQVTILFADVVGSTSMGESRDPETVFDIMDAALSRFCRVVEQHGGLVGRLMGDGLLAFFGAPTAREDDPVRAVHTGLAIVASARDFADTVRERWSIDAFSVRVGIHSGLAALGEVGNRAGSEYTAMGDTTNVAARLQSAAPPQGVLISHETYCLVRGLFTMVTQPPLLLKGKAEPFQAYLVSRAVPRAFRQRRRGVEGIETRMVGRDHELRQLQAALHRSQQSSELQFLLISGDAGIGKSRLLYEFERWAQVETETSTYLYGRTSQDMQHRPYGLIRDVITSYLQIQASDPPDVVRAKMTNGVTALLGDNDDGRMRSHFVGQMLGFDFSDSTSLQGVLDDARQVRDRALVYLKQFLAGVIQQGPTLLLLEDLHWADASSLAALPGLLAPFSQQKFTIVATARAELWQRHPDWGRDIPGFAQIVLHTLSHDDGQVLVREILRQVDDLPDALCSLLLAHTEGNPFYLEELIKMLIEDGVILKNGASWCVETAELPNLRVPATLAGVLQARLDSLPAAEREILQQASVVGRRFWDDAVAYINQAAGEPTPTEIVTRRLAALQAKEIVFKRQHSTIAEAHEYIFKHVTLRDVAYERVLRGQRSFYHEKAAEWLISRTGRRIGEYVGLIADHLEMANKPALAANYLRRAGEQAAGQYANDEALTYFKRALALVEPSQPALRYDIFAALEHIYNLIGARPAQEAALAQMRQLTDILGGADRQGDVALRTANLAWATTDYAAALAAAAAAIQVGQSSQNEAVEAGGYLFQARIHLRQGAYAAANASIEQGLTRSASELTRRRRGDLLRTLGIVLYYNGDYAGSRLRFEEALAIYRHPDVQDRQGEAATLNNLGGVCADQGDLDAARQYGEQALLVAREIGDRDGEGFILGNLGSFIHDQGDSVTAIRYLEESAAICRETAERSYEANALTNLGSAYINLGRAAKAEAHLRHAIEIYIDLGDQRGEANALSLLGLLRQRLGNHEVAIEMLQRSLTIAEKIGSPNSQGQALTFLGHALADKGRLSEAAATYRQALALQADLDEFHLMPEPLAGLARIELHQGALPAAMAHIAKIEKHLDPARMLNGAQLCPVYLTCYQVLMANHDPAAAAYLQMANDHLQQLATQFEDVAQRQQFLNSRRCYRDILAIK